MECEIRSKTYEWYEDIIALFTDAVMHREAAASRPDPNLGGIARGAARFLRSGERPILWAVCQSTVPCSVDGSVHRERIRALRHPGLYERRRAEAVAEAVRDFSSCVTQRIRDMVHARRDERSSAHLYPQEEEEDRQERRTLVDYRYLNQVHAPPAASAMLCVPQDAGRASERTMVPQIGSADRGGSASIDAPADPSAAGWGAPVSS